MSPKTIDCKTEGLTPKLMDSRRTNRSAQYWLPSPALSGKAAFFLKNLLVFPKDYSGAGIVAGVFFDYDSNSVR